MLSFRLSTLPNYAAATSVSSRRWILSLIIAATFTLTLYKYTSRSETLGATQHEYLANPVYGLNVSSPWTSVPVHYPVKSLVNLPIGSPNTIPRIQHDFSKTKESAEDKKIKEARQQAVREGFVHAWKGYSENAWMKDEISPISGGFRDSFGGWAATLVDSLDTLWIMGFKQEFDDAVRDVVKIDFGNSSMETISVFETTIRYLGGFLAAYDLSGRRALLRKAVELGEMLYVAFDTPNRMPVNYFTLKSAAEGVPQEASANTPAADIGSLSLEFSRLSQLSGDNKYFDAIQRITDHVVQQQNETQLPGMWPVWIDAQNANFSAGNQFSLGALSDSLYEYLPKQYMILGGVRQEYRRIYEIALDTAKKHTFFRPLNRENLDILISGTVNVENGEIQLDPVAQHLTCYVGGMVAIGAKIFQRDELAIARKLVDGCSWAYNTLPSEIMPEKFSVIPCSTDCKWDEDTWYAETLKRFPGYNGSISDLIQEERLPNGFTEVMDRRYILRPEAIESLFILYRITGDKTLQDQAWKMFQAIDKHARTNIAHAALADVTVPNPPQVNEMESFWTAETLKYFYLIFSDPDLVSLDDYVFNTEAHPLRRPMRRRGGLLGWWD